MLCRTMFSLCLLPALVPAQMPGAADRLIHELQNVRTLLERIESGQNALAALLKIQIEERRLAAVEAQLVQLDSQESEGSAAPAARQSDSAPLPELASVPAGGREPKLSPLQRTSEESNRARASLETEAARRRARIAELEKFLEAIGR